MLARSSSKSSRKAVNGGEPWPISRVTGQPTVAADPTSHPANVHQLPTCAPPLVAQRRCHIAGCQSYTCRAACLQRVEALASIGNLVSLTSVNPLIYPKIHVISASGCHLPQGDGQDCAMLSHTNLRELLACMPEQKMPCSQCSRSATMRQTFGRLFFGSPEVARKLYSSKKRDQPNMWT